MLPTARMSMPDRSACTCSPLAPTPQALEPPVRLGGSQRCWDWALVGSHWISETYPTLRSLCGRLGGVGTSNPDESRDGQGVRGAPPRDPRVPPLRLPSNGEHLCVLPRERRDGGATSGLSCHGLDEPCGRHRREKIGMSKLRPARQKDSARDRAVYRTTA